MLSETVRARIRELGRGNSPRLGLPDSEAHAPFTKQPQSVALDLPIGRETENTVGCHWLIERQLDDLWPAADRHVTHGIERCRQTRKGGADVHAEMAAFCASFPHEVLLLDLETCGFAGSAIFLAGLLHWSEDRLVLTQLWARSYAEERPVLHTLRSIAHRCRVLGTFNGKSFDWPQVRDRIALHERGEAIESNHLVHFDLLHHARRRWRRELPNCKLQTLERYLCGRRRTGDIPGRDIPQAYHDYVRSGDTTRVRSILHHNALDLITLLQLALHLVPDND